MAVFSSTLVAILCAIGALATPTPPRKTNVQAEYSTNPKYFQGDMILPGGNGRSGLKDPAKLWTQGKVYYKIASSFTASEIGIIKKAMEHISKNSCITFHEATNQKAYIDINSRESGCQAVVGRDPYYQPQSLNLGDGCLRYNKWDTAAHEMLHAIGFYHEQSRPDRDDYINIYTQNAPSDLQHAWVKTSWNTVTDSDTPYDYDSIMHYDSYAFSNNQKPTMLKKNGDLIIRHEVMSPTDIEELNKLYKCSSGGVTDGGGTGTGGCRDKEGDCSYWADTGECTKNPSYMNGNCPKACKQC